MRAAAFVAACFVVGFLVGWVAGRIRKVDELRLAASQDYPEQWRQGCAWGRLEGERDGFQQGWTTGRLQLLDEQEAQRRHPTGSPLSHLRALDAEADRRMKGDA